MKISSSSQKITNNLYKAELSHVGTSRHIDAKGVVLTSKFCKANPALAGSSFNLQFLIKLVSGYCSVKLLGHRYAESTYKLAIFLEASTDCSPFHPSFCPRPAA